MIKGRGVSQIGNLTPDHNSLENMGWTRCNWGVLYTIGNIFLKAIIYMSHFQKKTWFEKNMNVQNFMQQESQFWNSPRKSDI
jgi:hypothetical protein